MTREDGWPAWREIAGDEARPHAARHARVFLFSMGQGPEPARADWQWVGAEAAAAAPREAGPDEVRASGHPEAEYVASSVEAFAGSGAPLTIRQGVQLKVALKYAKPPVWRSVQLPLTATSATCTRRSRSCSAGTGITCTSSTRAASAAATRSTSWKGPRTKRRPGSATPFPRAGRRSRTRTTSVPTESTRSPGRR
jgi:hypothetical protein